MDEYTVNEMESDVCSKQDSDMESGSMLPYDSAEEKEMRDRFNSMRQVMRKKIEASVPQSNNQAAAGALISTVRDYLNKTEPSEQIVQMGTGAQRSSNAGKGRFDLMNPLVMRRLAGVYERGANLYGARNWEQGIPFSRILDSAKRHINAFECCGGDPTYLKEDNIAQAIWNLCALAFFEETRPDLNDLPNYEAMAKNFESTTYHIKK